LLDVAEAWLRERGRDRMVGPMDFTTNDEIGVLIAGHEHAAQRTPGIGRRFTSSNQLPFGYQPRPFFTSLPSFCKPGSTR
jgi:hypothetical protein